MIGKKLKKKSRKCNQYTAVIGKIHTLENRLKIIAWVNKQFQFTAKHLYAYMGDDSSDSQIAEHCRAVLQAGKINGHIQTVSKGKYILVKPIPDNMRMITQWSKRLTKREQKYGKEK